ncbi:glycine zipper 2TM domain-containing protein [Castellaniella sp.]|uniref:glycine zipper 2TM domain-containing protein n=1 Tax=Castellaniella sp. TaxID=1955812 RepID=UPI003A8F4757
MAISTISVIPRRAVRLVAVLGVSVSLLALAGCANQSASGSVYTYGQAQQEQIVRYGTVVSVRPVVIQSDKSSGIGALAGGALGGVAGSSIGGGRGQILTSIGGALLGGLAGNAVENQVGKTQGLEITVRLDNGETRVIAQANDIQLSSGQRVQVISGGGPTRVVPM